MLSLRFRKRKKKIQNRQKFSKLSFIPACTVLYEILREKYPSILMMQQK